MLQLARVNNSYTLTYIEFYALIKDAYGSNDCTLLNLTSIDAASYKIFYIPILLPRRGFLYRYPSHRLENGKLKSVKSHRRVTEKERDFVKISRGYLVGGGGVSEAKRNVHVNLSVLIQIRSPLHTFHV